VRVRNRVSHRVRVDFRDIVGVKIGLGLRLALGFE